MLPDQPRLLFAKDAARVPYLIGANADEGVLFHLEPGVLPVTTEAEYEAALHRRFGGRAADILDVYPAADFATPEAAIRQVTGDFELVCETNDSARRAADAGLEVYSYDFSVGVEVPLEPGTPFATHGLEIPFIWGDGITFSREDRKASHLAMQGYWSRFAEIGDPNGDGAVTWPKFTTAGDQRLQFETGTERVVTNYRSTECALWRTLYDSFDPGRPGSGDTTQ
jgi:para-nitrobenzyl esterase